MRTCIVHKGYRWRFSFSFRGRSKFLCWKRTIITGRWRRCTWNWSGLRSFPERYPAFDQSLSPCVPRGNNITHAAAAAPYCLEFLMSPSNTPFLYYTNTVILNGYRSFLSLSLSLSLSLPPFLKSRFSSLHHAAFSLYFYQPCFSRSLHSPPVVPFDARFAGESRVREAMGTTVLALICLKLQYEGRTYVEELSCIMRIYIYGTIYMR